MAQFGSLSVTAACGGCRKHERRQWSKLCEAKSEQTILGTTRGHFDKLSRIVHFQTCNLKLKFYIGVWLSLVERLVREYGSKGSNIKPQIVKPVDTPCFKALLKFSKKAKKWLWPQICPHRELFLKPKNLISRCGSIW